MISLFPAKRKWQRAFPTRLADHSSSNYKEKEICFAPANKPAQVDITGPGQELFLLRLFVRCLTLS